MDIDFIETPAKEYKHIKKIKINIQGADDMQRKQLRATIKIHRNNIKAMRKSIKRQKLLIKRARNEFKLSK